MRPTSESAGPVNPYEPSDAAPADLSRRASKRFGFEFAFALLLSGGLFVAIIRTRYSFGNIFSDFELDLPLITTIALSPWTLVAVGGIFAFAVAKEFIQGRPTFVRNCNAFICLAMLVLGVAYGIAIFLPLIGTISALS